jgi:hypothetical protein
MTKRLTRPRTVHIFCEYLSPVDESVQTEERAPNRKIPFNAGHNDLANDNYEREAA